MKAAKHLDVNLKLRLDTPTHKAVQRLAKRGDRSVVQELRRAIRNHVAAETARLKAEREDAS